MTDILLSCWGRNRQTSSSPPPAEAIFLLPDQRPAFDTANEPPHGWHGSSACTKPTTTAALALSGACDFLPHRTHAACPPSMAFPTVLLSIPTVIKKILKLIIKLSSTASGQALRSHSDGLHTRLGSIPGTPVLHTRYPGPPMHTRRPCGPRGAFHWRAP